MDSVATRTPPTATEGAAALADLVERTSSEAERLRVQAERAALEARGARRELALAQAALEEAQAAADNRRVAEAKSAARRQYQAATAAAIDDLGRQRAAAAWLREIDRINRRSRSAISALVKAQDRAGRLRMQVETLELTADARRIRAEAAAAAHLEARRRFLEGARAGATAASGATPLVRVPAGPRRPSPRRVLTPEDPVAPPPPPRTALDPTSPAATARAQQVAVREPRASEGAPTTVGQQGRPTMAEREEPSTGPLVIEGLLAGDRELLRHVASEVAEMVGSTPSRSQLLLQELVDAIVAAATDEGSYAMDRRHPFWAQFSSDEARTVARALRDLGFRFDRRDGWYGGRVPTGSDLALALAYAGFDVRGLRRLPTGQELQELPSSVAIDALAFLAANAPTLELEPLTRLLGRHAERLGDLFDEWPRVMPLLLEDADSVLARA
jgi:hypothetical protein